MQRFRDGFRDRDCQKHTDHQHHQKKRQIALHLIRHLHLQLFLKLLHVDHLIIGILRDVILNHRAQTLDVILPDIDIFIVISTGSGISNHFIHCPLQGIQTGEDTSYLDITVRPRFPLDRRSERLSRRRNQAVGILDHRRILRLALDNISIFELFRVDQPDHNTVHRILHIRFELYVVLIRRL